MTTIVSEQLFLSTLTNAGFSITRARKAVFSALENADPLTMNELVSTLKGSIDRASIYRTIDLFEQLHIVDRISIGWKYKLELSDRFSHHHHHIICEMCGRIDELIGSAKIEASLINSSQLLGYDVHTHQIEVRGICANCQKHTPKHYT